MLTEVQCKAAICPPDVKRRRIADSGGLYLEVAPNGSKRWFWKFRVAGVEKRLALGGYPSVSLAFARRARDEARLAKDKGHDPVALKKTAKLLANYSSEDSFETVAREWYSKQKSQWSPAVEIRRTLTL